MGSRIKFLKMHLKPLIERRNQKSPKLLENSQNYKLMGSKMKFLKINLKPLMGRRNQKPPKLENIQNFLNLKPKNLGKNSKWRKPKKREIRKQRKPLSFQENEKNAREMEEGGRNVFRRRRWSVMSSGDDWWAVSLFKPSGFPTCCKGVIGSMISI